MNTATDTPLNITIIAEVDLKARVARELYGDGGAVLCTPNTKGDGLLPEVAEVLDVHGPAQDGLVQRGAGAAPAKELS